MLTSTRRLVAIVLVGVLAGLALGCKPGTSRSNATTDPDLVVLSLGGEFVLTGDDGKPFDSRTLHGGISLLFFGYTTCPEACPTMLAKLVRVYTLLDREHLRDRVRTVFVSIDPQRDRPEPLRKYLSYFAIPAVGVTGSEAELETLAVSFGASFERVATTSEAGYLMNHTTYLYLIDGLGRVRHVFSHDDPAEKIADLTVKATRLACCR